MLYTGDCKMAALETRAEIAAHGDFYLTSLPMTGATKAQFATWVEAAVSGEAGGEVGRDPSARTTHRTGDTSSTGRNPPWLATSGHTWTERVQVIRSDSLAETQAAALKRRLEKAEAAVRA